MRLDRYYVVATITLIALVLSLELMNTAMESIVDLLTVAHHPLAKSAKDAAAGAVLVAAIGGRLRLFVFYQGIINGGQRVFSAVQNVHRTSPSLSLAVVAIGTVFAKAWFGRGSALQGGAVSGHAALAFAVATLLALFYQRPLAAMLGVLRRLPRGPEPRRGANPPSLGGILGRRVRDDSSALAIFLLVRPHVML